MPYIETPDHVQLYYQDWGAGTPVVFVSGWALSSSMWQGQMIDLVDHGVRCIAYDRRGHGRSDQPGHGYDYDSLADDLAALVDSLDLKGVTLVAHSMGGGEIVRYLSRHGSDQVARLALVAPLGPYPLLALDNPNGFDPALVAAIRDRWRRDFPSWMDASADGTLAEGCPAAMCRMGWWSGRSRTCCVRRCWLIECNRSGVETDLRPEMTSIRRPTLIIQGDHDTD